MSAQVTSSPAASDASLAGLVGVAADSGWVEIDKASCPPAGHIPGWCAEDTDRNRQESSQVQAPGCVGDASCNCDIHWGQRTNPRDSRASSQPNDLSSSTLEPNSSQLQASTLATGLSREASLEPITPFEILDQSFKSLYGDMVDVDFITQESENSTIYDEPESDFQGDGILGGFEVADLVYAAASDDGILARFRSMNPQVNTSVRVGDTTVLQHSSSYYALLQEVLPIKHGLEFAIRQLIANMKMNFEETASKAPVQARLYTMAVSMAKSLDVMEKLLVQDFRYGDSSIVDPDLASEDLKAILRDAHDGWITFTHKLASLQHTLVGVEQKRRFDNAYFQFLDNNHAPASGAKYLHGMREMIKVRRWFDGRLESAVDLLDQMDALVIVNRQHVQRISAYLHHHRTSTPDWGSLSMPITRQRME